MASASSSGGGHERESKTSESAAAPAAASAGAPKHTNRLINEQSPYLLQHAHNPVDWHPWGEEAFRLARERACLIFLSVGYSTCHWCHVMEHESFEDEEVARFLNENFVCIKVDREERPDVDKVYMTFIQAISGGGGWPMSVFLTPDLKPVFGGTYFPPRSSYGRPSFMTVLHKLSDAWRTERQTMISSAEEVMASLKDSTEAAVAEDMSGGLSPRDVERMRELFLKQMAARFDSKLGGFGSAPKFPRPSELNLLFRCFHRMKGGSEAAAKNVLNMALTTLRAIALGGVNDHLGGGIARYSVDAYWHVPHFEKMLYDQAQLLVAYATAYSITKDAFFRGVALSIVRYLRRDMTHREGGLFSAEDADSLNPAGHKSEGAFYVWRASEIDRVVGDERRASLFKFMFYVKDQGNADLSPASDPHEEFRELNILIQRHSVEECAAKFGLAAADVEREIAAAKASLFEARSRRPRPGLDDKVLTAWNGLALSAYATAYRVFCLGEADERLAGEARGIVDDALRIAGFARRFLSAPGGELYRSFRKRPSGLGYAEDYAFFIAGLLDLFSVSWDAQWLQWALQLQAKQDELFWDAKSSEGGYFDTSGRDASVLLRMKNDYDGAEPTANSVSALNLLRIYHFTGTDGVRARALQTIGALGERLRRAPVAVPQMGCAADASSAPHAQLVVMHRGDAKAETDALAHEGLREFDPDLELLVLEEGGASQRALGELNAFFGSLACVEGRPTAFLCRNFACQLPTSDPEKLRRSLRSTK